MFDPHMDLLRSMQSMVEQAIHDHLDAATYRDEAAKWKRKYEDLLDSTIQSSEEMNANLLRALCDAERLKEKSE